MDGKDAIIDKIVKDAESKAEELILGAKEFAEEKKKAAELWAREYKRTQSEIARRDASDMVERRKIVAKLETKKITLKYKRALVDEAFDSVYDKLCSLERKEYVAFVEKMLCENAETGDTVVLSGDGKIGAHELEKLPVFSEKKLSLSDKAGDFTGGVKLIGKTCDKDLSFKSVVEEAKENYTSSVAAILFS